MRGIALAIKSCDDQFGTDFQVHVATDAHLTDVIKGPGQGGRPTQHRMVLGRELTIIKPRMVVASGQRGYTWNCGMR